MFSFWEKDAYQNYDYIIVGGGLVGLSAAASLAEKKPKSHILLIERGLFASGASSRNAGFACFGSLSEIVSDVEKIGKEATFALIKQRLEGLKILKERLGVSALAYQQHGGYELFLEENPPALEKIEQVNEMLRELLKSEVFQVRSELISSFEFSEEKTKHLVFNPFEGQLHPGKMVRNLEKYVRIKGGDIRSGSEVLRIEGRQNDFRVWVKDARSGEHFCFCSPRIAVCTNAFIQGMGLGLPVTPGRGQVLVTQKLPGLPWKGTFHFDEGFYYFRNYGQRVIFGGGRNLDIPGESTTEFGLQRRITQDLEEKLRKIILPKAFPVIDQYWSGIMAFTPDKKPILRKRKDGLVVGAGLNGMGVALGSSVGQGVAKLMVEES